VLALGGAKNHIILVPDADEAITIPGIVDSFTGCAGQRCMAASVLLAVGDVDTLLGKIVERAKSIEVGPQMGAIIDKASHERILGYIDRAEKAGAKIVVDGRGKNPGQGYDAGNWMGPTIIDNTTADMEISCSEVFGPVISIIRVPNLTAAMAIENANPYGNAASVFTTNGAIAQHVADNARAGMIGVNIGVPVPREPFSFGGIQDSKFGTGDITGESSLNFWSHIKKITRKWSAQTDKSWMSLARGRRTTTRERIDVYPFPFFFPPTKCPKTTETASVRSSIPRRLGEGRSGKPDHCACELRLVAERSVAETPPGG